MAHCAHGRDQGPRYGWLDASASRRVIVARGSLRRHRGRIARADDTISRETARSDRTAPRGTAQDDGLNRRARGSDEEVARVSGPQTTTGSDRPQTTTTIDRSRRTRGRPCHASLSTMTQPRVDCKSGAGGLARVMARNANRRCATSRPAQRSARQALFSPAEDLSTQGMRPLQVNLISCRSSFQLRHSAPRCL